MHRHGLGRGPCLLPHARRPAAGRDPVAGRCPAHLHVGVAALGRVDSPGRRARSRRPGRTLGAAAQGGAGPVRGVPGRTARRVLRRSAGGGGGPGCRADRGRGARQCRRGPVDRARLHGPAPRAGAPAHLHDVHPRPPGGPPAARRRAAVLRTRRRRRALPRAQLHRPAAVRAGRGHLGRGVRPRLACGSPRPVPQRPRGSGPVGGVGPRRGHRPADGCPCGGGELGGRAGGRAARRGTDGVGRRAVRRPGAAPGLPRRPCPARPNRSPWPRCWPGWTDA